MSVYKVIGLMSGSSLDGLDIAYCHFENQNGSWQFSIKTAACIPYTDEWTKRLRTARQLNGKDLWQLHTAYGHLLAQFVNNFIAENNLASKVDLIASHGHTVFHFPEEHFTAQIGDGAALATGTSIIVACDFRSADIALGGQGAPIVPIGDMLLFSQYNYLLNIGGIANLTAKTENKIIAFDICAANQVLDYYAGQKGLEYDKDGAIAASGIVNTPLLEALNALEYYRRPYPKSLDNGFSHSHIITLTDSFDISIEDKLCTYCHHIAIQIAAHIASIKAPEKGALFITGGGAFNTYLIKAIAEHTALQVHVPSAEIIKYKEALVMAFIGLLRLRSEVNVLSSVTGASRNSIGGALYHP